MTCGSSDYPRHNGIRSELAKPIIFRVDVRDHPLSSLVAFRRKGYGPRGLLCLSLRLGSVRHGHPDWCPKLVFFTCLPNMLLGSLKVRR